MIVKLQQRNHYFNQTMLVKMCQSDAVWNTEKKFEVRFEQSYDDDELWGVQTIQKKENEDKQEFLPK